MVRRGRPTKSGERYKCGKRTPTAIQEDVMSTAVQGRLRVYAIKPEKHYPVFDDDGKMVGSIAGKDLAKSDLIGSALGRLVFMGLITTKQADAGYNFAETMRDYLATANLQRPTQGKAGFIPTQRSSGDSAEPVRGEAKAKLYMDALRETDRLDLSSAPSATSVVWAICIEEKDWFSDAAIGALRVGLNAVHRVWYGRKAA